MFRSLLSNPIIKRPFNIKRNVFFESSCILKPKIQLKSLDLLNITSLNPKLKYHSESNLKNEKEDFQKLLGGRIISESFKPENSTLGGALSFSLITSTLVLAIAAHLYQKESFKEKTDNKLHWLSSFIQAGFGFNDLFVISESSIFESEISYSLEYLKKEVNSRIEALQEKWSFLSRGEKAIWGIIGVNIAVFVLWKIPSLDPFFSRHFCCSVKSDRYYTLLTSCFSHRDLMHIGFNMMALHSFGQAASMYFAPEHLVAFYLTAGILSSLTRHLAFAFPKIFSNINFMIPSIGASGAIFGIVSFVAYHKPHSQTSIIFLPGIRFELKDTLACLMALDMLGILKGWKFFDHFAHLGGALFGLAYAKWGTEYIWIPINRVVFQVKRLYYQYTQ